MAALAAKEVDLANKNDSLDESRRTLVEKDKELTKNEKLLQRKDTELISRDKILAEKEKILSEKEKALAEMGSATDAVQSELDDLLMVFGDLEDKVSKYKVYGLQFQHPMLLLIYSSNDLKLWVKSYQTVKMRKETTMRMGRGATVMKMRMSTNCMLIRLCCSNNSRIRMYKVLIFLSIVSIVGI